MNDDNDLICWLFACMVALILFAILIFLIWRCHNMNAKQSLRAASKYIEEQEKQIAELERLNKLYAADVKNYYDCIEGTVDGKSICDWCEDLDVCQLQDKGGKGCKEWLLRSQPVEQDDQDGR